MRALASPKGQGQDTPHLYLHHHPSHFSYSQQSASVTKHKCTARRAEVSERVKVMKEKERTREHSKKLADKEAKFRRN